MVFLEILASANQVGFHSDSHIYDYIHSLILMVSYFQITSDYNSSSLTVEAHNTNSTTDNGIYNCQIILSIVEIDTISSNSNYSMVSFKGT